MTAKFERPTVEKHVEDALSRSTLYANIAPDKQERFKRGITDFSCGFINSPSFGSFKRDGFRQALTEEQEQQMRDLLQSVDKPNTVMKGLQSVVKNILRMEASPRVFRSMQDLERYNNRKRATAPEQIVAGEQRKTNEVAPPTQRRKFPRSKEVK